MQNGMALQDPDAFSSMSATFGSSENGDADANDEASTDLLSAAWDVLSLAFWLSVEITNNRSLTECESCAEKYKMIEQRTIMAAKRAHTPRTRL
jgi:hypothetical protein